MRIFRIILLAAALMLLASCSPRLAPGSASSEGTAFMPRPEGFADRYAREEMVILSRHNIRSPLSGPGSVLSRITPHEWFDWSSAPGELSLRGGALEMEMGQFFREWLVGEGFFVKNGVPEEGSVRFYANSIQRTRATARAFAAGMFPMADIDVEQHTPMGTMDPVFNPQITRLSEGFLEKAYRGFHCAAYSLLDDKCIWPVINGSTFYIDDFPSPVPEGDSQFIQKDYGMDIKDFYTHHWWKDVYNLSKKYNIRYTGLVIEDYSAQVSGVFPRNKDITRFQYFGNMLLREGGELGYHGYNHMPLVPESFDYMGLYDSYRQWESVEAMRDSLIELRNFCQSVFPGEEYHVYVPPSNIISPEGRELLAKDFPEIRAIASLYLPDDNDVSYSQDFTVTDDGMVQTPRIISGYVLDDYMRAAAMSELYFHCVNTHFQHPDDVLDTDRGAALGWEELFNRLTDYVEWLHSAIPQLRNLTGSELTGAVQRYDALQIRREDTARGIHISLGGFCDEAWFYLRVNEGRPGRVSGGTISQASDGLYLVKAASPELEIEINK